MNAAPASLDGKLALHPRFAPALARIGADGAPVIVIDNFLRQPAVLIEYAAAHSVFEGVTDTFYPGVRAPIPPIYCFALRAFLGRLMAEAFGFGASPVVGELAHFSLITTPPAKLNALQRMPHIDTTDPRQLAVLHYLCDGAQGGTSFYRHRRTGFEFIDAPRSPPYQAAIAQDLAAVGLAEDGYICGHNRLFERTAAFEAAFNRVLIYRSFQLHSADIRPGFAFDPDPRAGRLTANTFFYYR